MNKNLTKSIERKRRMRKITLDENLNIIKFYYLDSPIDSNFSYVANINYECENGKYKIKDITIYSKDCVEICKLSHKDICNILNNLPISKNDMYFLRNKFRKTDITNDEFKSLFIKLFIYNFLNSK